MSRIEEAVRRLRSGEPAILIDEDRGEVCTLVAAADAATAESWTKLAEYGQGAPVLALDAALADRLRGEAAGSAGLFGEQPSDANTAEPALRVIRSALSRAASSVDVERLGIVPRRIATGGVLVHPSDAAAAVDALRLADRAPAALVAAMRLTGGVLTRDGAAASFAAEHGLPLFSIQDVIAERLSRETVVEAAASARLPSVYASVPLEVRAFRSLIDGSEHLAMLHGPLGPDPLVRLHSECLTGDALGSLRCDCGEQLRRSLQLIAEYPAGGVVVYLRGQEGRGIGLVNKIRAYALQDLGRDTVEANTELGFPADLRDYGIAVQILRSLGVASLKLLSNNPRKAAALERYGIRVSEQISLRVGANPHNADYLETKRLKLGHDLGSRR